MPYRTFEDMMNGVMDRIQGGSITLQAGVLNVGSVSAQPQLVQSTLYDPHTGKLVIMCDFFTLGETDAVCG